MIKTPASYNPYDFFHDFPKVKVPDDYIETYNRLPSGQWADGVHLTQKGQEAYRSSGAGHVIMRDVNGTGGPWFIFEQTDDGETKAMLCALALNVASVEKNGWGKDLKPEAWIELNQDPKARQLVMKTLRMARFNYKEVEQDGKFFGVVTFLDDAAARHFEANVYPALQTLRM